MKRIKAHNSLLPIFYAWQLHPLGHNYNLSFSYKLPSFEDGNEVVKKLTKLVRLRPHLRQTFILEDDILFVNIHDHLDPIIQIVNVNSQDVEEYQRNIAKEPHKIDKESSVKISLVSITDTHEAVIIFNIHHILMDGISLENFVNELNTLLSGKDLQEQTSEAFITKYSGCHQLEAISDEQTKTHYDKILKIHSAMELPTINSQNEVLHYTSLLPQQTKGMLENVSHSISIFNLLHISWGVLLSKLLHQDSIVSSYPVDIRQSHNPEGCYVNLVPFAFLFNQDDCFESLLEEIKKTLPLQKLLSHSYIPSESCSDIPTFACSNFVKCPDICFNGKSFEANNFPQIANSFFTLKYRAIKDELIFSIEILDEIYPLHFVESLLERYFYLLNNLLSNPTTPISQIDLAFQSEINEICYSLNNSEIDKKDLTLVDVFFETAKSMNGKTAVIDIHQEISYDTLAYESKTLAKYLLNIVGSSTGELPIGILSEKSYNQVVSSMAIMASGNCYVPLGIDWPLKRIVDVLEQSGSPFILISQNLYNLKDIKASLSKNYQLIVIETLLKKIREENNFTQDISDISLPKIEPNSLAYIIFTSGSTGKPKGVSIPHYGVLNTLNAINSEFMVSSNDAVLSISEFTFDLSVYDIFGMLIVGGTITFPEQKKSRNTKHWIELIQKHKITLWNTVPQLASLLIEGVIEHDAAPDSIRLFLLSGDWIPVLLPTRLKSQFGNAEIISLGGATETSIWSVWFKINFIDSLWNKIPYGLAMPNQSLYVLSPSLNHCPFGVPGEMYIGGLGVARNYYNDIEKSKNSFIEHDELGRLYKTGDLGVWNKAGFVEFIGRKDHQVKIHGYRIELEEISSKLNQINGIDESICLLSKQNELDIILAYYRGVELDETEIIMHLKSHLPEYMIPAKIIYIDAFPLTENGKLDRSSLPKPKININAYEAPNNSKELIICDAFSKTLDIETIGTNDDFFQLGGTSLTAISLITKLQKNFNISLRDIFDFKTPKQIATHVNINNDNLKQHLENIKRCYEIKNKNSIKSQNNFVSSSYETNEVNRDNPFECNKLSHVLLTGATGFLGCNILHELLTKTSYRVLLPIRAGSNENAFLRIQERYKFYFYPSELEHYFHRIEVFASDLELEHLGLGDKDYTYLTHNVDSIIHAAALTKHFGDHRQFYMANVLATKNLLELCSATDNKDFHYISTISVLEGIIQNKDEVPIYSEEDRSLDLSRASNVYLTTKYEGEKLVFDYQKHDLHTHIYRVGNLAFMLQNNKTQINDEDNAFCNRIDSFTKLGYIAHEVAIEEITPADVTATAIVKLFDKKIPNRIYHIFNPNYFNLIDFFSCTDSSHVKAVHLSKFIDIIYEKLTDPKSQNFVERFMLHEGWIDDWEQLQYSREIRQLNTEKILNQLGFSWTIMSKEAIFAFLEQYIKEKLHRGEKCKNTQIS